MPMASLMLMVERAATPEDKSKEGSSYILFCFFLFFPLANLTLTRFSSCVSQFLVEILAVLSTSLQKQFYNTGCAERITGK